MCRTAISLLDDWIEAMMLKFLSESDRFYMAYHCLLLLLCV